MAKLDDCSEQLRALLEQVISTNQSYRYAKDTLAKLQGDENVDLSGIGLTLSFDNGVAIPVASPTDREGLIDLVAGGAAFLSREIVRLWNEVHRVACEAKQHCDAAAAKAAAAESGS